MIFWTCSILLCLIHIIDMELTRHYIGNDWNLEVFPPMCWAIHKFGIEWAVWISRGIVYGYLYFLYKNRTSENWIAGLVLLTTVYWTSMVGWLFDLELVEWPL